MRKLIGALVACVGALAVPASSQAIVNGSIDGNAHPNVGALTANLGGQQEYACSGTLISPTVMVTASHCTAQLEQLGFTQTTVSFAPSIRNGDITCSLVDCAVDLSGKTYVGTLHTNPGFDGSTTGPDSHDVSVVTFGKAIKGIAPASLPAAGLLDGEASAGTFASDKFTAVGYGWHQVVSNGGEGTGLFDGQRRFATSGSQSLGQSVLKVTEDPSHGFGGACNHDSGGPAFLGTSGTTVGVVSEVNTPCTNLVTYYRLDTDSARAFLANYVTLP